MFSKNWLVALAALFVCVGPAHAAPIEAYGRLPTLSDVTLSPDGKTLAYVRGTETKRLLVIQTLGVKEPLALINVTDQKLRALQWADSDHLLITISMTTRPRGLSGGRGEFSLAQEFDLQTKSMHPLLEHVKGLRDSLGVMNVVAGVPEPRIIDGHAVVFVRGIYFPGEYGRYGLFRVDLTSGENRMVSREKRTNAEDWVIDEAGNIVAEQDYIERDQHWQLVLYRDGEPTTAVDVPAPIEGPSIEGLNEDGTAIIIRLPQAEDGTFYQQISIKDGSSTPWRHGDVRFGDVLSDIMSDRVIGGSRLTDKHDYVFFDPHLNFVWQAIKTAFNDATDIELVSKSNNASIVIVRAFGPAYGDSYFAVDMTSHKATLVGPAYDGLGEVAAVKWINYRAADGRVINAYLTLPLKGEAKNAPLVVLPHGGPHSRDFPGFDWLSQALAARGYVVLQPQFRGSLGFGTDLLTAGFGEFGHKMQTDLSDGVRALAAQGMIDAKRVCIVGASYGGYAALAGATLDTGVYRCAVSIAGVADLKEQLRSMHRPGRALDARGERFWDRFLNISDYDDPKLDAISPIKHVDKVSIPILLIHGRDDTVVPYAQSDDMADALKSAKKPFEFVTLPGEDHWLSKSETRLQMLEATVKFLEANNPPN